MALTIELGDLVELCKQRSDKVNDPSIDPAEWQSLITEVYGELHGLTVEKGARYFETEVTINLADLSLPADHLSTIGVDYVIDSAGRRDQLRRLAPQYRSRWLGQTGRARRWAQEGTSLALYPAPSSGTYKHLYVPQPVDLTTAPVDTEIDLLNIWGRKFVVWGVAAIALHKGEANQLRALDERNRAQVQVEYWATLRAFHDPNKRIADTEDDDDQADPADWRYR